MFSKQLYYCYVPARFFAISSSCCARNIKPWNVGLEGQYRKERAKKIVKVELPDFDKLRLETRLSPEEYYSKMKEKGIAPPIKYKEKPIVISSTQGVLDPYVPPEGDGKFSLLSKSGIIQKSHHIKQKTTSFMAIKKIKQYEDYFDLQAFSKEALSIYIKAHELLASNEKEELFDYVTEFVYPIMVFQRDFKTIKWNFIKTNEDPDIIQVRTQSMIEKTNIFAQITVRFNTRQILAIYDRFGHLMYGSEAIVKDVLEYVVFEKNISNYNGKWRLHAKIIPDWLPKKQPILHTFVKDEEPEPPTEEEINFHKHGFMSDEKKDDDEKNKNLATQ